PGPLARVHFARHARDPGPPPLLRLRAPRPRAARRLVGADRAPGGPLSHAAGCPASHFGHPPERGGHVTLPIVEARGVSKVFPMPAGPVAALRDLSLSLSAG